MGEKVWIARSVERERREALFPFLVRNEREVRPSLAGRDRFINGGIYVVASTENAHRQSASSQQEGGEEGGRSIWQVPYGIATVATLTITILQELQQRRH